MIQDSHFKCKTINQCLILRGRMEVLERNKDSPLPELPVPPNEKCPNTEFFLVRIFPEKYVVSLRIQSECWKIRTRKNSIFGHFSRSGTSR